MKKLLLSAGLIVAFLAYGLHQRSEGASVQINPQSNQINSSGNTTSNMNDSGTPPPGQSNTLSYKDGIYTGVPADAVYGNIQVKTIIQNGKITNVQFLQYPNDQNRSIEINTQAMPYLKQEAILAQSAQVDIVSGATDSSQAFIESLKSALNQAKS